MNMEKEDKNNLIDDVTEDTVLEVKLKEAGRLDKVLAKSISEISRNRIQQLIEEQRVFLNNIKVENKKTEADMGDEVRLIIPAPVELDIKPEDLKLDIVYEDDDILVINKPSGMVVHPCKGHYSGTLVHGLLHHCRGRLSDINGVIRPGIVHRIDMDTSGLLVVAKNNIAHERLAKELQEHLIERTYYALIYGRMKPECGVIDLPIGRDPNNRKRMWVCKQGGKRAITSYEEIEVFPAYSLLKLNLKTGRTHQIRVHLSYNRHPIVGDILYGPKKALVEGGQLLHAKKIAFTHPVTGDRMEFEVPLPLDFERVLEKLRKSGRI